MNAYQQLECAREENRALREALRLMGLDAQKVIEAVDSPLDNFWYRETLNLATPAICPDDPRIAMRGLTDRVVAAMESALLSLRLPG